MPVHGEKGDIYMRHCFYGILHIYKIVHLPNLLNDTVFVKSRLET